MRDKPARGKRLLQCMFGCAVALYSGWLVWAAWVFQTSTLKWADISFLIQIGLLYMTLKGKQWARWSVIVLAVIALPTGVSFHAKPHLPVIHAIALCITAYYIALIYVLLLSPSVKCYFESLKAQKANKAVEATADPPRS